MLYPIVLPGQGLKWYPEKINPESAAEGTEAGPAT